MSDSVDVLVHLLHRSERDMMLIGTSTTLSNGQCELYMQRRMVDDANRVRTSNIVVITYMSEDALVSAVSEQLDEFSDHGWHKHDWDPVTVTIPTYDDTDPGTIFDDAMRLFIAASEIDED